MRALWLFLILMAGLCAPSHASDPLRLRENFSVLELHPYLSDSEGQGAVFSIQNGGSTPIDLLITRPAPLDLFLAFARGIHKSQPLRLFSSDDREFAAAPGEGNLLRFSVPASQVRSFYLMGAGSSPTLYLWSPEGHAAYESRRQTFRAAVLLLLGLALGLALVVGIYRRSRRAAYAVIMGVGLMILLASLWMHDVLPDEGMLLDWQANRMLIIRVSFGIGVAMSVLAHVNLIIRQIINRNYWTRVIIISDLWLVISLGLWTWQIFDAGYAGLISSELGHIFMAMTCASVLLGAVFVPDRSHRR